MSIAGKGMYLWILSRCEGGDPTSLARVAVEAGLSHVLIKVADGSYSYNSEAPEFIDALLKAGVDVWGWQYVYGNKPAEEASIAIKRVRELNLDGFVIDAESEYKNKSSQALIYMKLLRAGLPGVELGLSSFRFPNMHRDFPWIEFLSNVDVNMPQVYWVEATNAGAQLKTCIEQFKSYPIRPIIPTGAAYLERGWKPTPGQVQEFIDTAKELGLTGYNFWEWGNTRKYCPELWEMIAFQDTEYQNPVVTEPEKLTTMVVRRCKVSSIITTWLNLREKPSVYSDVIGRLYPGDDVWELEESIDADGSVWVRVGHKQWAAMNYWYGGKLFKYLEWI